jgi:hypothetical protein
MERMMPVLSVDLSQQLHETNCRLSFWLDSLSANSMRPVSETAAATPQQMASLLSELMLAGEKLRALPAERDSELEKEVAAYRENVERLRAVLPSIHSTLLRERARLEQERARVESAAEWARRSRQTL